MSQDNFDAKNIYWGIDIGGTAVKMGTVDENGTILLSYEAEAENISTDDVIDHILTKVPVP